MGGVEETAARRQGRGGALLGGGTLVAVYGVFFFKNNRSDSFVQSDHLDYNLGVKFFLQQRNNTLPRRTDTFFFYCLMILKDFSHRLVGD